ncbi:DUF1580 domain-containing protein [Bremerella sp. JC770]|uniref:DUF1580 domain-containing protein n=1 Tax=Bremerella sp. JC770 TaxID=3232137 RepID=UPI00345A81D2
MTIDVKQESLLSFSALAGSLPSRREGRPVHVSTIYRWHAIGLQGVTLEAVRVGGGWCTSWEAFARFCDRLTALEEGSPQHRARSAQSCQRVDQLDQKLSDEQW